MTDRRTLIGTIAAALYVGTIFLANWMIQHVGEQPVPGGPHVIHVGFGLTAPSGVLAVGLAFTLRDVVHRTLGRGTVLAAILLGAGLSWLVAPAFAAASAAAFATSELADLAVYSPLERRTWLGAVALSNTVGLAVDSALFLSLAFGSLAFFWGQVVGKLWMTVLALAVLAVVRRWIPKRPALHAAAA